MIVNDVIIIGAGPAGLSTAIQLKRYGFAPKVFEKDMIGGLLRNANLVENYPGFPGGISGIKLVELFKEQASQTGIDVTFEEVSQLIFDSGCFHIKTTGCDYQSRLVIVASGTKPRQFSEFPIPVELENKIYYEIYPLLSHAGKTIAIVGAGDAAFDYALNLSQKNQVFLLNRGIDTHCLPLLEERVSRSMNITYFPQTSIFAISATAQQQLRLQCKTAEGETAMTVDYLLGAIGRDAQLDFIPATLLANRVELEKQGLLYCIGDVTNGLFRQTAIAAGQGILSAMKINQYLKEHYQ